MSLARKQAFISATAWLVISVVFTVLALRVGPEGFGAPEGKQTRAIVAAVILPGYLINFAILWWTRKGRRSGEIDERDKAIEYRATTIAFTLILMVVFLFGIGIYDANDQQGTVPVGWFYILAYGIVALVSFVHPTVTLIVDYSGRVHAQG